MAGVGRNNLCSIAMDLDPGEPSGRAPGNDPGAKVKAWLAARLGPDGMKEFEQFMASLGDEGQDEVDVRETGEGSGPGTKRRDAGDPAEDDDPDVPNATSMHGTGPQSLRGKRVSVQGYPGAQDARRWANDQARYESRWPMAHGEGDDRR